MACSLERVSQSYAEWRGGQVGASQGGGIAGPVVGPAATTTPRGVCLGATTPAEWFGRHALDTPEGLERSGGGALAEVDLGEHPQGRRRGLLHMALAGQPGALWIPPFDRGHDGGQLAERLAGPPRCLHGQTAQQLDPRMN